MLIVANRFRNHRRRLGHSIVGEPLQPKDLDAAVCGCLSEVQRALHGFVNLFTAHRGNADRSDLRPTVFSQNVSANVVRMNLQLLGQHRSKPSRIDKRSDTADAFR